ncbi:hypothetical protein M134_0418 [Bacteroides fragilis str. S24L34]|nr:hypothetical protein M134_0418 [Bacteroides fragilis str. S24L34]
MIFRIACSFHKSPVFSLLWRGIQMLAQFFMYQLRYWEL